MEIEQRQPECSNKKCKSLKLQLVLMTNNKVRTRLNVLCMTCGTLSLLNLDKISEDQIPESYSIEDEE